MRCACIDIGSNTTRLLVADREDGVLHEVLARRRFLHLACGPDGDIAPDDARALALVVAEHVAAAGEHGCEDLSVVATAAIRAAGNGDALCAAIRAEAGVAVEVLSEAQEATLAFAGATSGEAGDGELGVLDVGGGSSELVCGTRHHGVAWWASFPLGSGVLTARHITADPPTGAELDAVRADIAAALDAVRAPRPQGALAVGGSAMSLRRIAGDDLSRDAIAAAVDALAELPAEVAALHFGVHARRARLMPAGLLLIQAAWDALGAPPLRIADGGLREGVLLRGAPR